MGFSVMLRGAEKQGTLPHIQLPANCKCSLCVIVKHNRWGFAFYKLFALTILHVRQNVNLGYQ